MPDTPEAGAGRVRVLPEALANQIAAGEVVERPASVVKELIENAIDAGAERILVDIEEAGRGLIRVVDDGNGMSAEDAALAVMRHATSKVTSAEDLAAIATLGFRGEALPSIASVSRVSLVTRRAEDETATAIRIIGGGPAEASLAAAPVGTRIEVRDLFWNVPARLKFLKTDQTETQHVVELVKSFALGYPHLHLRLGTGARAALDFPPVRKLHERVVQVLGKDAGKHLHEVTLDERRGEGDRWVRVIGFVSSAREAKATQTAMTTFVNGRRVRDRTLAHALVSAFGAELGPGRFPQAVLWVHLDPADVDVNVHPAKAEVRFRAPQLVHEAVTRAIQSMLTRRPWIASEPLPLERRALEAEPARTRELPRLFPDGVSEREMTYARAQASETGSSVPHATELRFSSRPVAATLLRPEPRAPSAAWRLVGRARELAVVEGPEGLGVIDASALHEAMVRTELTAAAHPIPAQPLLMPARLDLAPHEAQRLGALAAELALLGIEVAPFGGTTVQLLALPQQALAASPSVVLAELAALAGKREASTALVIDVLARATARAVAARGFTEREVQALVDFVPKVAGVAGAGVFVLSGEEIARRLAGSGRA